ncbi:coiled-coil domain-containing protein 171-like [Physella acuta]|uniref:coiled-coil domain-containing protein 171-like n=1 Tax=Physella acuta TaxID=109671 RepID=UPI0027DB7AFD|nr:coiled-coil domain-containing protein 171-like [Physella acuta]
MSVDIKKVSLHLAPESSLTEGNPDISQPNTFMLEKDLQGGDFATYMDGALNNGQLANEVHRLRLSNKQLKLDLQAEEEQVLQLKKRLSNLEGQKLESTTKSNQELAALESQLAKVRSQVEKGEAVRQNLEYELTKCQRQLNQITQASREKENKLLDGTNDLTKKLNEITEEVKSLKTALQSTQANAHDEETKLKEDIEDLKEKLVRAERDLGSSLNERDKLTDLCQQHSSLISELNEHLQEYENEKRSLLDKLRRTTSELEYTKERESRLRTELESTQSRTKSLEENIEAERCSHLETKFNSEIVQLRVRDLDSALDVEKSANLEANKAIERLTQQNRELEDVYEEERKFRREAAQKLDKVEKEYVALRKQLLSELEEKKAMIATLSKELETHQKNFNELKTELSKAKKRQQYLEETYDGSIKELEFLLQTFRFEVKKQKVAAKEESNTVKGKKPSNPSIVVENFKQMLFQIKRKMDTQSEELLKVKKNVEKLTKELEASKEIISAKDKLIEDAHRNYTKTAKDLNKTRNNYAELEATVGKLKTNLQNNASNQNKDKSRIQELSDEVMKLVKRRRTEEEDRICFLQSLYQKLLAALPVPPAPDKNLNLSSWDDLADVVTEHISTMADLLQATDAKLKTCQMALQEKQEVCTELKQTHGDQITRLTNATREREQAWLLQKEDLEQHYKQIINDLQSRSKKTQAIADQAWEKVRATGNVQQGLESEVSQLRRELAESQVNASSLLAACALLSGVLYPLMSRTSTLASECHLLQETFATWEKCRTHAIYLSHVLSSGRETEPDKADKKLQKKKSPILKFRVLVLAVLASNRLAYLGQGSSSCFVAYVLSLGHAGVRFDVGGRTETGKFTGLTGKDAENTSSATDSNERQNSLTAWLTSQGLLDAVLSSVTEVLEVARKKEQTAHTDQRTLVSAARSSLSKLLDRIHRLFSNSPYFTQTALRDRSSLARKLEKCLSHTLNDTPNILKGSLISSQELMSTLQNHILDLTQKLHSAEKERRRQLSELTELKIQIGETTKSDEDGGDKTNSKNTKYVLASKFDKVCVELSLALNREQKAQVLLQEQSDQLTELTARLEVCVSDGLHQQNSLAHLQESLAEVEKELRQKEQHLRQMGKQSSQLEYERDSLVSNLKDAENALRASLRDKEILTLYIKNVESSLELVKKQFVLFVDSKMGDVSLAQILLNPELIPQDIGRAGQELIALQNLVGCFVDTQQQAVNKITSLEQEVVSHRIHINTLKQELSNAVHREFVEEVDDATNGAFSSFEGRQEFVLLKEDPNFSADSTKPLLKSTPPVSHSQKSAFQIVKSRHTEKKSPKKSQ